MLIIVDLTFDMSGGPKGAKRSLRRPIDGGVDHMLLEWLVSDRCDDYGLGRLSCFSVKHRFDVVPVRVEDESTIVAGM